MPLQHHLANCGEHNPRDKHPNCDEAMVLPSCFPHLARWHHKPQCRKGVYNQNLLIFSELFSLVYVSKDYNHDY
jgi:hypothetical protein